MPLPAAPATAEELAQWLRPPPESDLRSLIRNPDAEQREHPVVYGVWNGPPLIDGIPQGYKLIEGDIMVRENPDDGIAAVYQTDRWPGHVVPYYFDENVSQANANAMGVAMRWWESVAFVFFVPYQSGNLYFLHIRSSNANNSAVGPQAFGQIVNIFNWENTAIMAHELGHALGFYHEQSRRDRDVYVTINGGNICQNCCDGGSCDSQFELRNGSPVYGPYDFDSVMHYNRCAFSTNMAACTASCPAPAGETITVKPAYAAIWQCGSRFDPTPDTMFIGQRDHLSYWDSLVMSFLYSRPEWRFQAPGGDDDGPGDFVTPYETFREGWEDTPPGGVLWMLYPSVHSVNWVLNKPMTIAAPYGSVTLTR